MYGAGHKRGAAAGEAAGGGTSAKRPRPGLSASYAGSGGGSGSAAGRGRGRGRGDASAAAALAARPMAMELEEEEEEGADAWDGPGYGANGGTHLPDAAGSASEGEGEGDQGADEEGVRGHGDAGHVAAGAADSDAHAQEDAHMAAVPLKKRFTVAAAADVPPPPPPATTPGAGSGAASAVNAASGVSSMNASASTPSTAFAPAGGAADNAAAAEDEEEDSPADAWESTNINAVIPDFDDGYDSDLMGDEDDRLRLSALTELERETELAARYEARLLGRQTVQLQRMAQDEARLRRGNQARGRGAGASTAGGSHAAAAPTTPGAGAARGRGGGAATARGGGKAAAAAAPTPTSSSVASAAAAVPTATTKPVPSGSSESSSSSDSESEESSASSASSGARGRGRARRLRQTQQRAASAGSSSDDEISSAVKLSRRAGVRAAAKRHGLRRGLKDVGSGSSSSDSSDASASAASDSDASGGARPAARNSAGMDVSMRALKARHHRRDSGVSGGRGEAMYYSSDDEFDDEMAPAPVPALAPAFGGFAPPQAFASAYGAAAGGVPPAAYGMPPPASVPTMHNQLTSSEFSSMYAQNQSAALLTPYGAAVAADAMHGVQPQYQGFKLRDADPADLMTVCKNLFMRRTQLLLALDKPFLHKLIQGAFVRVLQPAALGASAAAKTYRLGRVVGAVATATVYDPWRGSEVMKRKVLNPLPGTNLHLHVAFGSSTMVPDPVRGPVPRLVAITMLSDSAPTQAEFDSYVARLRTQFANTGSTADQLPTVGEARREGAAKVSAACSSVYSKDVVEKAVRAHDAFVETRLRRIPNLALLRDTAEARLAIVQESLGKLPADSADAAKLAKEVTRLTNRLRKIAAEEDRRRASVRAREQEKLQNKTDVSTLTSLLNARIEKQNRRREAAVAAANRAREAQGIMEEDDGDPSKRRAPSASVLWGGAHDIAANLNRPAAAGAHATAAGASPAGGVASPAAPAAAASPFTLTAKTTLQGGGVASSPVASPTGAASTTAAGAAQTAPVVSFAEIRRRLGMA